MSLEDCIRRAMDAGEAERSRGERAQAMWRDLRDRYRRQGLRDDVADAAAAEDVKAAFRKEAGDKRHVFLAQAADLRRAQAQVEATDRPATLLTDLLEYAENSSNRSATIVGQKNALVRAFHYRLAEVINKHSRDLLGRNRDKAGLLNLVRELHGQSTGDHAAIAVARTVRDVFRDMRRMFNEAGGTIGELEDWGLPHSHNRSAIRKEGFQAWADAVRDRIAWHRMEDRLTGRPLVPEGAAPPRATQDEILGEVFDNIIFGRDSATPGATPREATATLRARPRMLHFKTADDWIAYNQRFGNKEPFGVIIGHAHRMALDIVLMRELGPNPTAGLEMRARLLADRARRDRDADLAHRIEGSAAHARRMLTVLRGNLAPSGPFQDFLASFMSTTRHVLTAAFLDRAILSALSDSNSMRMAAKAVGMNPAAPILRHIELMTRGMSREEAQRAGWIADTLADPGLALARWQNEAPPAEWAEKLATGVLRAQGLSGWTDYARIAFQMEMTGLFARNGQRPVAEVEEPLRSLLQAKGITDAEWQDFTSPAHLFRASNGATFAPPIYWRQVTGLPADRADDLFLKLQALVEEQTEFAVPTQSIWARAFVEGNAPPGSIAYEALKSATMFKSFTMTFTVNQVRRILAQSESGSRIRYAADFMAGATIMGAVSLQLLALSRGEDPMDMTAPDFWAMAALKSGAFGVLGDAIGAGERYQGFTSWAAGPVWGLIGDTYGLTMHNAVQLATGREPEIGSEAVRFVNRYLPGGDVPVIGLALDRIFFDSLLGFLDPEAMDALTQTAKRRATANGSALWWMPGSPVPSRAPRPASAAGG